MKNTVIDSPSHTKQWNKIRHHNQCSGSFQENCSLNNHPDQSDDSANLEAVYRLLKKVSGLQCNVSLKCHGYQRSHGNDPQAPDFYHDQNTDLSKQRPMGVGIHYYKSCYTGRTGRCKKCSQGVCPLSTFGRYR